MALRKCKECGHQVSTKAAACPNCGARQRKRTSVLTWIVAIILAFTIIPAVVMSTLDSNPGTPPPAHASTPAQHHPAPPAEKHETRHEAKHASVSAKVSGTFYDVEKGDPPGTSKKLKIAARLAAQGANCAKVTLSTYIPADQQYPEHKGQPYYVTCNAKHGPVQGFAYGVYFNEADLKGGVVKNQTQPISKERAIELCESAIKSQLHYPSSFDLKMFAGGGVSDNGTTNREVDLPFTALNGLGNRIPQLGKCIVQPNGHTDVTILNR